jgi:hypothetical protein
VFLAAALSYSGDCFDGKNSRSNNKPVSKVGYNAYIYQCGEFIYAWLAWFLR